MSSVDVGLGIVPYHDGMCRHGPRGAEGIIKEESTWLVGTGILTQDDVVKIFQEAASA